MSTSAQPFPPQQTPDPQHHPRTYAEHVADYALAGWPCVIPVPAADKFPPPTGFTGAEGRDTSPEQLVAWAGSHAHHSIALRMPPNVIGIDVDEYAKGAVTKTGAATLAEAEAQWGQLPATWCSTARGSAAGPGPSRILFFRVPPGRYATKLDGDVEVIQRHHRYAVVWPSPHSSVGAPYTWYDPAGTPSARVPGPAELTELPQAWVAGLAAGASPAAAAASDPASGAALLAQLEDDRRPECAEVTGARLTATEQMTRADAGARHDTMTSRAHALVHLGAAGHTGVGWALGELRGSWAQLTAGEDRGEELERALLSSARKAVTTSGHHQVTRDPCLLEAAFAIPAPAPGNEGGEAAGDAEPIVPPRWFSPREFIGTAAFDPNAGTDQALAAKVLERTYPALRYAYDSGGWLLRAPESWEPHGRLSAWAVAQVASLMPVGDPTAEKGSEQHERSVRRNRLMTSAGARAVAAKMDDLVVGGMHPCALRLGELDADPEILWAGGRAWSLRSSREMPTQALVDPASPHVHSAALAPAEVPTPHWDAFVAAVWPDPELRAWALRVLSVAVTGYADRALPILLGETGRGKTQVVALLMSVLGSYAHAANPKLLSPTVNEHDTIVYALKGRRLSFIDEAPSEAKVGQERLKQLTGGGELTARQMNQDPITFAPTHTFVLTANDEPVLTDPAVRARARLIPCEGDPEEVRAARAAIGFVSGPVWRAEAPGVLAQLMVESARWLADPSSAQVTAAPESIRYLAEHLGAEQDPVAVWLTEETEPFEEGTPSRELYQTFVASCRRNSMRPDAIPSETKWGRGLTRMGVQTMHTEHGKRRPIRVRTGGFVNPILASEPPVSLSAQPVSPTRQSEGPDLVSESDPGDQSRNPDGLTPLADGFLTGSEATRQEQNGRSDTASLSLADGLTGFSSSETLTRAHARAGEPDQKTRSTRQPSVASESVDRATAARERKAEEREAKRLEAVAEASGPSTLLPAVVTRDGEVRAASTADVDALLATITDPPDSELTVDVETTGYPVGHVDFALRTVQLGNEHLAVVLDPTEPEQADVVRRHMAAAAMLHAHSATADLVPLAQAGLLGDEAGVEDAWARMHDTVVLAKLDDPASTGSDPGLKQISAAMLGDYGTSKTADAARAALFRAGKWLTDVDVTTPVARSGWAQVDPTSATMLRYATADVLDDAAIATRLERPEPAVLDRERLAQRMTARVAHRGLPIDGEHVRRLLAEHTEARDAHAERVRTLTADLDDAAVANPGSTMQVAASLERLGAHLPRTRTGKASAAEAALSPLRNAEGPAGELAGAVLDYRHHSTAIGLFLEPYRELVERGDGRARPTVYTLAADTGRMSCVRPNLQQVPREGGFRAAITADPGHLLVSADFAGVELRVAAALSGDSNLRAILDDPSRDLHWEIARLAFGPEATKADRYAVKRGVFGRIYGGGVGAIAAGVGVSEPVAQSIIDALDALLPELTAWSRSVRDAVQSGRTRFGTYAGRVVYLPQAFPHKAPNYCIQGTARELLIDTLVRWSSTPWGAATLLPVHDELVVMVPEDQAEAATTALTEAMTTDLLGIPIVAEASEPMFAWRDSA